MVVLLAAGCTQPDMRTDPQDQPPLPVTAPARAEPALSTPAAEPARPGEDRSPTLPPPQEGIRTPDAGAQEVGASRGYMTTPAELMEIRRKADQGLEPYRTAVAATLAWAELDWSFPLQALEPCGDANEPAWIDNNAGIPTLYARALAYHLTGEMRYAQEVQEILERIMTEVEQISLDEQSCRLRFAWGTPELVAAADLIEAYWSANACSGPLGTAYEDTRLGEGNCKELFQNWLVKNPYYVVSYSAGSSQSNWGAAATNTTAAIADYLWDRPEVMLVHRNPPQIHQGDDVYLTPAQAYELANRQMFDRMNGYGVEYGSRDSCDTLDGRKQGRQWEPVKSQITENGIIPEDARRDEYCNITAYNGEYQNYPQLHLGHNIQQCELLLRRGDASCYDNVDLRDLPDYTFTDPDGITRSTHLRPGRGSIERAIKAVIVDSRTEWRHDSALAVAYRYYFAYHTLPGIESWQEQIDLSDECGQDICFGVLTHGFAPGETPELPPVVWPVSEPGL